MLTFDKPTHTYRWQGVVVPSVTQVLESACRFEFVTPEDLEAAQRRGTYVHEMTELSDTDALDDDAERDGPHWKRLLAWRKFVADYEPNWAAIETLGFSKLYRYAGTVDRLGVLERMGDDKWVIDIKTSASVGKSWGPQTAAYRQIAIEERGPAWAMARRATVRLHDDGSYNFDECKSRDDWRIFDAMLTLKHWSKS